MKTFKKVTEDIRVYKKIEKLLVENHFSCKESKDEYVLLRENLLIKVKKSKKGHTLEDYKRLQTAVNEAYGTGYADAGYYGNLGNGWPYIEYKIIPLNHSLEQKTSSREESRNRNKNFRSIHVGDYVIGKSKYSDKKYEGPVQRIVRDDAADIVTVYVLAKGKGQFMALDPETVKLSAPYPVVRISRRFINSGNVITNGIGAQVIGGSSI